MTNGGYHSFTFLFFFFILFFFFFVFVFVFSLLLFFYRISELMLATLILICDTKSFHFKNQGPAEILQAVRCHIL